MRWGVALLFTFATTTAWAQAPAPPPGQPPPYPPPGYGYPPPGYAYPPPVAYQPPEEIPYKEGAPIPVGYHEEERPRKGLVIAGFLVAGIPYGIGLMGALSANFKNESGWLAVPFAGPWLYMGRRDYACKKDNDEANDPDGNDGLSCVGEAFLIMGLIADGVMQAAGGTLLLIGYASPKKHVIRDGVTLRVTPMRIGSGQGLGVTGAF